MTRSRMQSHQRSLKARLGIALLTTAALLAAACGSTIGPDSQDQAASEDTSGLEELAPSEIPKGAHVNKHGEVINKQGEVIGTVEGSTSGGSALGGSTGGESTSGGAVESGGSTTADGYTAGGHEFGPGVTSKYILVGYAVNNNAKAGCETIGTCSVMANTEGMEHDFADWFNKHGGIAGRKIKLIKFEYSTTEATTNEQVTQRICTYFTEDRPVFAGIGSADENFNRCMNKGGVTLIDGQRSGLDAESFNATPYLYLTGGLHLTDGGIVQAKGLLESGYFEEPSPSKVGLLTWDDPAHQRAANEGLKKVLASGGVKIAAQENIYTPKSLAEVGRSDAEIQNAVLRFKTEGITHVMFLTADGGSLPLLFIRHAQDQNYFPRYGFNTSSGAATMVEGGEEIVQRRNFVGAVEPGWFPVSDVSPGQKYQKPAAFPECAKIAQKYGRPSSTTNERIVVANFCDFYRLLKAGIEAGLPNITPESFKLGVESLGHSWASAGAHQTSFGPLNHDGAGAYQVNRYYEKCRCFKPSGPIKRFK